ncbi:hypothetical protein TCAL_00179 [Tigriopus californicus]|uniref:WD repeat-containing protein 91 n=1 Tax=Tigriopus californicus TaxID=6832 RepID=A0A553P2K8_TIGCA|nr:WD repeat-containing protein 91-like [Tigriopus californicus]XP_059088012.1 WD repeat-containing protein 91-like [Tigriopus californicus]TRY71914.1 hypothetical protein TCAL_00179 [Tigriopus californicus]|eukprot:TCALIF_00179-PA protein Name:"Similar to Wdr91 WD repeat-containing protein 91 (Rattus norvegicus)" AED:0.02 eAED:0.02 QI:104/1/1/1/1/1/2/366/683
MNLPLGSLSGSGPSSGPWAGRSSWHALDELVRDYLLFRGFMPTLKMLDQEIKVDKEKGFRPDKIIDHILSLMGSHDLSGLRELWAHLQTRLFSRLEHKEAQAVSKLETGLFKLFVVHCVQTKHPEKVRTFFEVMSAELQSQSEWKDWFVLPFLTNPETHPTFAPFFSRHWQDTLLLSLFNLLALIYACLPPPKLADFRTSQSKIQTLQEENEALRRKLREMRIRDHRERPPSVPDIQPPEDVMDDFFIIAPESAPADVTSNTLKSFLRNITGTSANSSVVSASERRTAKPSSQLGTSSSSTSLKQSKPRSSSKSRVSHAPVKRLSQTSLNALPSASSTPNLAKSPAPPLSEPSSSPYPAPQDSIAYLLLSQEEYLEHQSEITHCRFSSTGALIASSDIDGVIKIWTPTPNPITQSTFIAQSAVTALDWVPTSDRHFLYGTRNGTVRFCDQVERKTQNEIHFEDQRTIRVLACSPNSNICALAASNASAELLTVYDLKTMTLLYELSDSTPICEVTSCSFNHNSQMLITSGIDGKIRIFDLRKQDCIASWMVHDQPISSSSLSLDETKIFALSQDGRFSGWSLYQTGQKCFDHQLDDPYYGSIKRQGVWNNQFALAGDGTHVLTCSSNGGIIYEFNTDEMTKVLGLKGLRNNAACTDWSAINDCGPCITASSAGQITISTLLSQ